MNHDRMTARLREMGLQKNYRPYYEPETGTIMLRTRKPAEIKVGKLAGCEIDVFDSSTLRVWTHQRQKAKAYSQAHGLKVRLLDGEAELYVPAHLADRLLPLFGARVKRELSPKQIEVLKQGRQKSPITSNFQKNAWRNGGPSNPNGRPAPLPFPGPGNA